MGRLEGKVAFVTGGGSGIGRACALRFAAEGARVAVVDLRPEPAAAVAGELGGDALALTADVTDEAAVQAAVADTVAAFGRIDTGLFAAGTGGGGPVHQLDADVFERVLRVNLHGVFLCLKHVAAALIAGGSGGSLTAIASLNARQPAEGFAAYCASKAGVAMLMQVAALELGRHGIRANAIGPGLIETPLSARLWQSETIGPAFVRETPAGRWAQPAEVAALAVYLAEDESGFMTGQTLYLDGGQSLKKYPEMFALRPPEPSR
jgi:NAD(P)-dependent dehydrogenase (short-subunit alcohol dehydrogenase family)